MTGAHSTAMPAAQAPGAGMSAVLFDMDGLLVDSEPLWFEVETEVMNRLGGHWTEADQRELLGSSLDNAVRYFLARATVPADPAEVAEWVMGGIVRQVRERGVTVMPGAIALVAEVAASGLPYALVTSSQRRFVDAVLARTGLRFPVVVCGSDVARGKPDPEPYLLAARRVGVPPGRCLALEDSITGVSAAEAAGCAVVAVPTLRPIEPRPGRLVVPSLHGVSLGWLRAAWAEAAPAVRARRDRDVRDARDARDGDRAPGLFTGYHWPPLAVSATGRASTPASGSRSGKWHAAR